MEQYPAITFTVTSTRVLEHDQVQVSGQVQAHGHTSPLTVPAKIDVEGETAHLTATVPLDRRHFGVKKLNLAKATLTVNASFNHV